MDKTEETKDKAPKKEENDWAKREIGALWKHQTVKQSFYSGRIELNDQEWDIVCFTNKNKQKDSHPDIRIYLSEPKQ
jgi:uncharacterized protein (DUF736 family)